MGGSACPGMDASFYCVSALAWLLEMGESVSLLCCGCLRSVENSREQDGGEA